jgi:hypothetical protein
MERFIALSYALDTKEPFVASGSVGDTRSSLKPCTEIALYGFADNINVVNGQLLVGAAWPHTYNTWQMPAKARRRR